MQDHFLSDTFSIRSIVVASPRVEIQYVPAAAVFCLQPRLSLTFQEGSTKGAEPFAPQAALKDHGGQMTTVKVTEKSFTSTGRQGIVVPDFWAARPAPQLAKAGGV